MLHAMLLLYSVSSVFSKIASSFQFISFPWCLCYLAMLLLLGVYAIGWQQVLKRFPLTFAFANKAVTVIWGAIWGVVVFHESFSVGQLVALGLVALGVVIFSMSDKVQDDER